MSSLRDLVSDLVEKRLWPVAVVLVVALVAVPFVLAKSPTVEPTATPTAVAAAAAAAADVTPSEPAVSVVAKSSSSAPLRGRTKNPFRQQHVPPKDKTAEGGGTPPVETGTPAPADPSGGGSPGGAPTTPLKTYSVASIDVRFGRAARELHSHEAVPRLTPLPGPGKPIVVFLGMRKDLKTAVFLLSSDVHAQGDGTCTPSRTECTSIEVKEGDVVLLDVTGPAGHVKQYELELVKVTITETTSKSDAQAAYARVSHAGARVLARRVRLSARNTAVGGPRLRIPYRYAVARGILHIAPFLSRQLAGGPHASDSRRMTRRAVSKPVQTAPAVTP